jgi:hypothetical protein
MTYISVIHKHNFNEYYSCEHNIHKNKPNKMKVTIKRTSQSFNQRVLGTVYVRSINYGSAAQ